MIFQNAPNTAPCATMRQNAMNVLKDSSWMKSWNVKVRQFGIDCRILFSFTNLFSLHKTINIYQVHHNMYQLLLQNVPLTAHYAIMRQNVMSVHKDSTWEEMEIVNVSILMLFRTVQLNMNHLLVEWTHDVLDEF